VLDRGPGPQLSIGDGEVRITWNGLRRFGSDRWWPADGEVSLFNLGAVRTTRYRYLGTKTPRARRSPCRRAHIDPAAGGRGRRGGRVGCRALRRCPGRSNRGQTRPGRARRVQQRHHPVGGRRAGRRGRPGRRRAAAAARSLARRVHRGPMPSGPGRRGPGRRTCFNGDATEAAGQRLVDRWWCDLPRRPRTAPRRSRRREPELALASARPASLAAVENTLARATGQSRVFVRPGQSAWIAPDPSAISCRTSPHHTSQRRTPDAECYVGDGAR